MDSRSDEGSSTCQNVNNNNEYKGCILNEFVNLLNATVVVCGLGVVH